LIEGVSQGFQVSIFEYSQRLSFVPLNPTLYATSAKSQAEAVIDFVYCFKFDGKMHLFNQNEMARRLRL